ncbi:MAG: HAMP domain-containing histidine kinase [Ruminococcaceae bacterium]|nr:HAMP domain-containing histidine kinase [Oscillospiraceae bacterium]
MQKLKFTKKLNLSKKIEQTLHPVSLETRWEKTALIAVLVFIVIFSVALTVIINMFYTNAVRERINSLHTDTVDAYFSSYTDSESSFTNGAIQFTNNFRYSDKMEVWIISASGKPLISSSGLLIDNTVKMPDYEAALNSADGRGEWKGKLNGAESVMAVTNLLKNENGECIGAVRYITSLTKLNTQVFLIMLSVIFLIICVAALLFSFNKSFIRSVTSPIKALKDTAASIAKGDFEVKSRYNRKDEIGELYDSMGYMATELGRIDKMKNEFITTVSHELRTPLTAIGGWGETLISMEDSDPELNKKGLQVIVSESQRLMSLVEELLDFSRVQQDTFIMKKEPIDLLAELDEIALVFGQTARRDGKEFRYDAPEIPAMCKGDADRIKQAFVNIIGNAIKYTDEGGMIDIHANIVDAQLIIFVRDNGCGISEEDLPRVKEKFFKANDRVHGNGIGLAVADEIITRHGGTLDIKSTLGEGTIVKITLPLGLD